MDYTMELICTGRGIAKKYKQMLLDIADECSLSAAELSVLLFLENECKDTAGEIAKARHMSKASVSKAVDSLYQKEYISGKADQGDRRIVHLSIEKKADEVLCVACQRQSELMDCIFQSISQEEMEILGQIAHKINRNLCSKGRNS